MANRKYHFFDKPLGYLGQLMSEDELLYADFEHVTIAVRGVPFRALDSNNIQPETIRANLLRVTDVSDSDETFCDHCDENLAVAFAVPEALVRETHTWFSDTYISHVMSALMTCTIRHSRGKEAPVMLLNISRNISEVVICRDGLLLFANHYRTSGAEDVLYYTLAVLENLQLKHDLMAIRCVGSGAADVAPVLKTYIQDVSHVLLSEILFPSDFPVVESTDLICLNQCAS